VRDLQNEIMNLHDSIEKENNAKVKFIQEMDDYKRKFNSLESENRQLKASLGGQDRLNSYPI
jgi:cell shape-determining protein MreC